jgi:hypothetical protein
MATHTTLKGEPQVGESQLSDQLEANLYNWLQWSTLGAGGFINIRIPTSGAWGGNFERLRLVEDPNYTDGQVWEGVRRDWVWETGIERVASQQPIRVSGVFVNGSFHSPSDTGGYSHHIDYPNGRVVFDVAVNPSSVVTCEHTQRLFQFHTADAPWWRQVQADSFRVEDPQFLQFGSGVWDTLSENRVQLPAVVVESDTHCEAVGWQLGGGEIMRQDVVFHVLAEDRFYYKWAHDVLCRQVNKNIKSFDKNGLLAADAWPLGPDGSPRPSGKMYPDLVKPTGEAGFFWKTLTFDRMRSVGQPRIGGIHYCQVRATMTVNLGP